jgi:hypothetical protein
MVNEKCNVEDVLKMDIEEINKNRINADCVLCDENNYVDLLEDVGNYFYSLSDEYFYSADSDWVEFFKSKIVEWFGEDHGLAVIDKEYWLLSFAFTHGDVPLWDMSRIDTEDFENARKLVKLMSVIEEIGSLLHK